MSIFQKSVVNRYLKNLDEEKVNLAFEKFQKFYGDKERLQNIMQLKEENYQEGFLREVFVQTLGYTINPDKNYNLTTEYKNQKDSRKADGAILKNGNAIGVIELKSTKTKDLESIKEQAFGYKVNQPNCKYVITSNFQSIRFYIDNTTEYEEFNLFDLTKEQFRIFYLILHKDSILNHLPEKLKKETKFHDEQITEKLYKDYQAFKNRIFEYLVSGNPQYDKLTLFKKSQKLLDRFLFILFAEDSGLIPPNAISKIIEQWKQLQELEEYKPLYSRFQLFFKHLDKGHTYKNWGEIPAYNGGLFRYDEILDNPDLKLPDGLLQNHVPVLSAYDFSSEVDVNILGHIFEHSLSEIEELAAELQGDTIDNTNSKRKKDGIFYTPKYITKYIVENTVGTICKEMKVKLQISGLLIDESYYVKSQGRASQKLNKKGKELFKTLQNYRNWLLTLKILDPACGSGAFLNQTLEFLITEHRLIDNLIAELTGDKIGLFDTDIEILENNIYGVDINEESVEIAKLSLWLRTAQRGRELSDLSNNIKCGNSLIDDPEVAGEKAFDWNVEFKEIMDKGGFDVVLGNPPWGSKMQIRDSKWIANKYGIDNKNLNLFLPFIYLSFNIIKKNAVVHLLIPKVFIKNTTYNETRKFILENCSINQLIDYGIFPGVASETISIAYSKQKNEGTTIVTTFETSEKYHIHIINQTLFAINSVYAFSFQITKQKAIIIDKIINKSIQLSEITQIKRGIEIGQNSDILECEHCKSYNVISSKYYSQKSEVCKVCNKIIANKKIISISSRIKDDFYNIKCLSGREISRYSINNYYYIPEQLKAIDYKNHIKDAKIFIKRISTNIQAVYFPKNSNVLSFNTLYNLYDFTENPLYIIAILNSKGLNFYYEMSFNLGMNLTTQLTIEYLKMLPIPQIPKQAQQPFIEKAGLVLSLNEKLLSEKENFVNTLMEEKHLQKIPKTLENFNKLDFEGLKKEIGKQKARFALGQETNEWREYFNTTKQKINELQSQINRTDKEIDHMVYELYKLTGEEIDIIEKSVK